MLRHARTCWGCRGAALRHAPEECPRQVPGGEATAAVNQVHDKDTWTPSTLGRRFLPYVESALAIKPHPLIPRSSLTLPCSPAGVLPGDPWPKATDQIHGWLFFFSLCSLRVKHWIYPLTSAATSKTSFSISFGNCIFHSIFLFQKYFLLICWNFYV